jgi:hypothetical protein
MMMQAYQEHPQSTLSLAAYTSSPEQLEEQNLPSGWEAYWNEEDKVVYFNEATRLHNIILIIYLRNQKSKRLQPSTPGATTMNHITQVNVKTRVCLLSQPGTFP